MTRFNLKIAFIIFLSSIIISCRNNKVKNDQDKRNLSNNMSPNDTNTLDTKYTMATTLNDKAVSIAKKYPKNKDSLNKSLEYLSKAIEMDSTSIESYINKMIIFNLLKQRHKVIEEAKAILEFNSDNIVVNINAYLNLGNEYMNIGNIDSANFNYDMAKRLLINEMKTDDNINYQITLFTILSIQKGKRATLLYFYNTIDSSKRTDYIKTFIDTFSTGNYLKHY